MLVLNQNIKELLEFFLISHKLLTKHLLSVDMYQSRAIPDAIYHVIPVVNSVSCETYRRR